MIRHRTRSRKKGITIKLTAKKNTIMENLTILQNTCFVAVGKDLRGFAVSAAASPTSSVPENANAAVTNTEQNPLKPSRKGTRLGRGCVVMEASTYC